MALFDGSDLLDARHRVLGRGHAEQLVPMIAELPERGRAERIIVSRGPGSFTGVRIGIAAARALGIAWQAKVLGYPTLALVAAMARNSHPGPVTVCMAGGHGEWLVQDFNAEGSPEGSFRSANPAEVTKAAHHPVIAGSKAAEMAELVGSEQIALDILPDARSAFAVPEALLAPDVSPIYGRAPDARLPI